jgi:hypothetical protein
MPPCCGAPLSSTGFRGITTRPYRNFAASITAVSQRIWIDMFRTLDKAMRTYDAAAWRFGHGRCELNFPEVESAEELRFLAPPPLLEVCEERHIHELTVWRISITKVDERLIVEHWRLHLEDMAKEKVFWAQKKQERRAARAEKRRKKAWIEVEYNNTNTELNDKDPHWLECNFLTSKESTDTDGRIGKE